MTLDDQARLRSGVWVQAQLRLCDRAAIPFVVQRRGDPDAGAILIKLDRGAGGILVLSRGYLPDGRRAWVRAMGEKAVSEAEADAYLTRQIDFDPDIWILAIEDGGGRYQPDGQVI
jgi:hypothetical protein